MLELQSANNTAPEIIASGPPVNSALPEISPNSSIVVGTALTCTDGSWTQFPDSYAYQWLRGSTAVGTNSDSYTVAAGDAGAMISCRVTATNGMGSAQATSVAVGPVGAALSVPVKLTDPAVSPATGVQVGTTLNTTNGTWTNAPTGYVRAWLANGTAISPAQTGTSYAPVAGDVGKTISCRVTASNAAGAGSPAVSNSTNAVTAAGSSPFVRVYAMDIDTPGGRIVIRPGWNANADNTYNVPANTIYDFRGRVTEKHYPSDPGINPFRFNSMTATSTVCGGKTYCANQAYLDMTWSQAYDKTIAPGDHIPSTRTENCVAGSKMQGFDFHGDLDAIVPEGPAIHALTYENFRVIACHDDPIQNDNQCAFNFNNGYFQGHTFISERPSGTGVKGKPMRLRHCLVHMKRQPYDGDMKAHAGVDGADYGVAASRRAGPYNGPTQRNNGLVAIPPLFSTGAANTPCWAHKWFFKTDQIVIGETTLMNLDIEDCLFRIDTMPVEGATGGRCIFPTDGSYNRLTVLWLGPTNTGTGYGPWPFAQSKTTLAAMGITVIDDEQQAWDLWNTTEAAWYAANNWNRASYTDNTGTFSWNRPP